MPFTTAYAAAVVHGTVNGVESDATAKETQRKNARLWAERIDRTVQTFGVRLLVLPVLPLTSNSRSVAGVSMEAVAVELPGEEFQPILDACARNNCYVATTTQEKTSRIPGKFFHTGFVLGPTGLVLRSPKAQAFSAPETTALRDMVAEYEAAFGAGSVLPVAETELGTLGCMVESEVFVPEVARLLRTKGAEIIVHPTLERAGGEAPYQAMKQSAGYANGVYLLSASPARVFSPVSDGAWMGGTSTIIGPEGDILASVGGGAGVAIGTIDPARLAEVRKANARYTKPAGTLFGGLYA